MLEILDIALVLIAAIAVLLGAVRAVIGPHMADRVIALDMLTVAGVGFAALAARASGSTAFLDVALGIALLGFIATIAFSRMVERMPDAASEQEQEDRT